jgi:glycosyltransferase involved in cell wall biosynthesis
VALSVRVLLVVQQLRRRVPGGIGTYVRGLLQGLEPSSSVTVYAGRLYAGPLSGLRDDPLFALGRPLRRSVLPPAVLSRLWGGAVVDVPPGFEVVHAPSLDAPPARRASLTVTVHDLAWRQVPEAFPPRGRRWHEAALRRAVSRAAALVVPSAPVADALARGGAEARRVHVIAHGADHLPAPDDDAASALLEGLGVRSDFVLSVGTLEPRKNLSRLMAAHGRAVQRWHDPLPLVVVGPAGWGGVGLGDPSGYRPVAGRGGVKLAGPVDGATLAALYRRARLLAFVPLLEGFGLPPLEAMAAGTPVLSSPVPSVGDAALVVDPCDVEAIAAGLLRLAGDHDLRAELSERGRARAAAHTWAASAAAHVELWERLG